MYYGGMIQSCETLITDETHCIKLSINFEKQNRFHIVRVNGGGDKYVRKKEMNVSGCLKTGCNNE